MIKVTYKLNSTFSLKCYKDSHINARSYDYPLINTIKSAILGAVIQLDGVDKAKELFPRIKNSLVYIQYSEAYKQFIKIRRISNKVLEKWEKEDTKFNSVPAPRQYCIMDKICFYIDENIPDIEVYLKNIDYLGSSNSLVYLESIEKVDKLENVLVEWNGVDEVDLYEMYSWDSKTKFDDVYLFSRKTSYKGRRYMCQIKDIGV